MPKSSVWIKFTLENISNNFIEKELIFDHGYIQEVVLYGEDKIKYAGLWHKDKSMNSFVPRFTIGLGAKEKRVYYLKVHSEFSTMFLKIILLDLKKLDIDNKNFYRLLLIIFTIISTLIIYNTMIYIFTKDFAYLYYILYLSVFSMAYFLHIGFLQLHLLSEILTQTLAKCFPFIDGLVVFTIAQFTRIFLRTEQFTKLDKVIRWYIYIGIVITILGCNNFFFDTRIIVALLPLGILLLFTAFYSLYKGVKEAKFYILGWIFVLFSVMTVPLRTIGVFDVAQYIDHLNLKALTLEAFLFSLALAHRIKLLNEENTEKQLTLLALKKDEQERLEILVAQKTNHIRTLLKQKETLYQELNHRVKNNLLMILSLVKLQISRSKEETKQELIVTKNRIHSIAHLYESLQLDSQDISNETLTHFKTIVNNIQGDSHSEIKVIYDVSYDLSDNDLLYAGLILNELVTNAFKYAFKERGILMISLSIREGNIMMFIKDNGIGFQEKKSHTLGLTIVQTLVEEQLLGEMSILSKEGTSICIEWSIDA